MKKFQSTTHVQEFLNSNIRLFIEDGNSSLIAFLYSVMISRGLAKLKSKLISLFRNKRFMLGEMALRNTSKFAIFLEYETASCRFFHFSFSAMYTV